MPPFNCATVLPNGQLQADRHSRGTLFWNPVVPDDFL